MKEGHYMLDNRATVSKSIFLKEKESLLKDFGIRFTPEISNKISELYPNEIAVENYTRKLILDKLDD